jgi:hypothetical protein
MIKKGVSVQYQYKGSNMRPSKFQNSSNNEALAEALKLSEELLEMAEKGVPTCTDDFCLLLYGIIRDCGYKIRRAAEQEPYPIP